MDWITNFGNNNKNTIYSGLYRCIRNNSARHQGEGLTLEIVLVTPTHPHTVQHWDEEMTSRRICKWEVGEYANCKLLRACASSAHIPPPPCLIYFCSFASHLLKLWDLAFLSAAIWRYCSNGNIKYIIDKKSRCKMCRKWYECWEIVQRN